MFNLGGWGGWGRLGGGENCVNLREGLRIEI